MRKGGDIMHAGLNAFTQALSDFCRENVLAEKWLLAPSLRAGFQWLDAVTRSGRPVLNVRVKTVQHLALDLAGPEMDGHGMTFLRARRAEVLIDRIVGRLRADRSGYLSELNPSPGLIQTLLAAVRDLRLAGLSTGDLRESAFEVEPKAREVRTLLSEYEEELAQGKLVDYADVLRMAAARVGEAGAALPDDAFVLIPQDAEENLKGLERAFWDALAPRVRKVLPVDQPCTAPDGELTDPDLLRWISAPGDAPAPNRDGAARLFRAIGEVNEVREVLRRCMEQKLAFDEVEIIHTDAQTYVPVVFEVAARLMPEGIETLPVTFAEGVPVRYSRPGRALAAWLAWIREGFPQATLVRMIQDGLVQVPGARDAGFSSARLGAILRAVMIGAGADRYLGAMDAERNALAARIHRHPARVADLEKRLAGLKRLRPVVADLLKISPHENDDPRATLTHAEQFVTTHARYDSQLDAYSRRKILDDIREQRDSLEDEDVAAGLDVRDWLAALPGEARVCGQGPRPGCLFVSNLDRGGHSGRRHTFIVGLDDSRFPGAGLQDPLLLDRERHGLSGDLPTAAGRLARRLESFERLLARLRGTVTMSFCCRDLAEDRDMFPSGILLAAYRILSGNAAGDQEAMLKWGELAAPASFAPAHEARGVDTAEWWLWRLCAGGRVQNAKKLIGACFPHLGRGFRAADARASDRFTEYDGYVPEAGRESDPTQKDGPVLSASRLETLGACPLEYFFRYILDIAPPEEYEIDPNVWLDPAQKGALLHAVFRDFMTRLREADLRPRLDRDGKLLQEILEENIAACKGETPPPARDVFDREVEELRQTARIFLIEEETFCETSRPAYFEVAIGLPPDRPGESIDVAEPVEVRLPRGETFRARGRIDRLDEVQGGDGKHFSIWDYKTGSSWGYARDDPFRQGRRVQNALYLALADASLRKGVSPEARAVEFGYFFPNRRAHGERIAWPVSELVAGGDVLQRLCRMIALGCFPFTNDPADVRYSDYAAAFGDAERMAQRVEAKLANTENEALEPFRELRGDATEDPV